MISILGFLAALGPLVVFHEFGHYLFARLFGVKAEIFSVGFGPRIWGHRWGETEWRISAIPLGGYVKLLGDEGDREIAPEDRDRTLTSKAPWKRFFIFLGGPLFNFILAVLIFMAILVIGDRQTASVAGRVVFGSPAAMAGFQSGDRIVAVNGKPVTKYQEVDRAISASPDHEMVMDVVHLASGETQPVPIRVIPKKQEGFSQYGEVIQVGEIEGLIPWGRSTKVGISDPTSLAGKAGMMTGDHVVSINGVAIGSWEEVERLYRIAAPGSILKFAVGAKDANVGSAGLKEINVSKGDSKRTLGEVSGLRSAELFVDSTVKDSPASAAGLKSGDRLIGISNVDVESFMLLREAVQKSGQNDGKVIVRWERAGKLETATINPTSTETVDPLLRKSTQFTIGVVPMLEWAEPAEVIEKFRNPITLVSMAVGRMIDLSRMNLVSIGKMVRGEVSMAVMGGPIAIGKIAGDSLSRGLAAFLTTMAMLSVGLGVLNLLPIPVLDGGHLMLLTIEAIRGKPLTIRQMEVIQQVGLSLILLLMVIVIRNDIARLSFFK